MSSPPPPTGIQPPVGAVEEFGDDQVLAQLPRWSHGWPPLMRAAASADLSVEQRQRWLDGWPQAVQDLLAFAADPSAGAEWAWPEPDTPRRQVQQVLSVIFDAVQAAITPAASLMRAVPADTGAARMAWLEPALADAARRLALDPLHPALPVHSETAPTAQLQLLLNEVRHGGQRAVLLLQAVPASGAHLAFVPAPANALTLCTPAFNTALHGVTRLLRRQLATAGPAVLDLALQWNLYAPQQPLLALDGPSAGAAFAVAALWLLQRHLDDDDPLRLALADLPAWLLRSAAISIAIDDQGRLHPVGEVVAKAPAYLRAGAAAGAPGTELPRNLFLHPDNRAQLNAADLPGVALHAPRDLLGLLEHLATASQPVKAFRDVLPLMPLLAAAADDDDQPPPSAGDQQRHRATFDAAWQQRACVRDLRDYAIARWARWAREDGGELHMRFVPLALVPADGAPGLPPRLSGGTRPGLAALLAEVHDPDLGADRLQALLLSGGPGAGKSTLLQRHEQTLALAWLRRQHAPGGLADAGATVYEVPLYLPLKALPADADPVAWVREQARSLYPACEPLHQLLRGIRPPGSETAQLRLLLDGLNEMPEPAHEGRVQRANRVVNRLRSELGLVLAPLLSARGQHGFELLDSVQRGACVQVQRWPADLVLRYVRRCFAQRLPDGRVQVAPEGEALAQALQQPGHRDVAELCRTPFNASGQVRLWAAGRHALVSHRADLYRRLLHHALLRELQLDEATGLPLNPLFHDAQLLSPQDRRQLQDLHAWSQGQPDWPREGALLSGLFRQALDQWLAADRPPHERGTVQVPWNHPARAPAPDALESPTPRSAAHWLPPPLRERWRQAVRALGLLADDLPGADPGFSFSHQSWGEYLASESLLRQPVDRLLPALQAGRDFERGAEAELQHQRQQADALWWTGRTGQEWWQRLLDEPLELPLSGLRQWLVQGGYSQDAFFEPKDAPRARWTYWQYLRDQGALDLDEALDRCRVNLRRWGDMLDLPSRHGQAQRPWHMQPSCIRGLVLSELWPPVEDVVRGRVEQMAGAEEARTLWRASGQLRLRDPGPLDEVLGLALLGLPDPAPWLRWLLQHDLWPALQPMLGDLQRKLEGQAPSAGPRAPHPVLQHLRRVLLLRSLDAGPASRAPVERSGQWALLCSLDAQCDPQLQTHWHQECKAAFATGAAGRPGRDLRERLQAARMLGVLGDNIRFEPAAAAQGNGLRLKPALWADVGRPGKPTRHLVGSKAGDNQASNDERPWFRSPPLPHYQVARLPLTCNEWRAFVEAGGYDPQAAHWSRAGPAAQQWLRQRLHQAGIPWAGYRPHALEDGDWGEALAPVTTITVFEAQAYAHWASPMYAGPEGAPAPSEGAWQVRLPTEVQWEAAMRVGPDGMPAALPPEPGALDFNHVATGWGRPSPVGVFSRGYGAAGQADGQGNVWEWCANALPQGTSPYGQPGAQDEAQAAWDGSDLHSPRALRGGAFNDTASQCRPAYRDRNHPDNHDGDIGVRLVRVWLPHS